MVNYGLGEAMTMGNWAVARQLFKKPLQKFRKIFFKKHNSCVYIKIAL